MIENVICSHCTKGREIRAMGRCSGCYQKYLRQRREGRGEVIKNRIAIAIEKSVSVADTFKDTMYGVGLHIEAMEKEVGRLNDRIKELEEMEEDYNQLLKLVHAARERFGSSEAVSLKQEKNGNLERVGERV